ncbi:hypothetical protein MM221_15730 [Salipaludibacillus sp. LMS25]|uniref:hypothetical protein n=1 Tax=Salipaludibacillus sp. LMS25 TaxID=2924031 RepID=UPI0020D06B66|nr:hypothetical protein [Salipaludibacillus sp. LMS25]UTR14044.1 hypothetical protein MM221_15730 [Salipaludibacillus sp. LMS25]
MITLVEKIFGKPPAYTILRVFYWIYAVFYFIALIMGGISLFTLAEHWGNSVSFLLFLILYPLLFRLFFKLLETLLTHLNFKKRKTWFIMGGGFIVIFGGIIVSLLLFADNVTYNYSKAVVNGQLEVTIGTLKGSTEIEDIQVYQSSLVSIPFEGAVSEGTADLIVKDEDDVIMWEADLASSQENEITFQAQADTMYVILLQTEEAKELHLTLDLTN